MMEPELSKAPAQPAAVETRTNRGGRYPMLDGWRAVSIIFVMAGHLLPIGPSSWQLNGALATLGMAIFFTLSGFLITSFLLKRDDVSDFIARRLLRILPLAWGAMLVLTLVDGADPVQAAWNFAFLSNLPPTHLLHGGEHLWSLCVEVQFYLGVAVLVALLGKRALWLLPIFAIAITALRFANDAKISIYTYERIDEIFAGATLALIYHRRSLSGVPWFATLLIAPLAFASAHEGTGAICYLRPYLTASMVGCTLFAAPAIMRRLYENRLMLYIAEVSYGLYVFHGMLASSWLGSGSTLIKYLKRPLLFALTFLLADLSYRFYERPVRRGGYRMFVRLTGRERSSRVVAL